ncbi:hypothetical protein, partial [Argonema antarcticum]|uniref:hypothetical protein n=1 Tax=Argonema antarcticum TaxID=2942763 RepID=UPI0020128715
PHPHNAPIIHKDYRNTLFKLLIFSHNFRLFRNCYAFVQKNNIFIPPTPPVSHSPTPPLPHSPTLPLPHSPTPPLSRYNKSKDCLDLLIWDSYGSRSFNRKTPKALR